MRVLILGGDGIEHRPDTIPPPWRKMQGMEHYTAQEVARRGKEIYERRLRSEVEPEHEGRFLVVDVESGEYALADDELEAFDRAREKKPAGVLYLLRVGYPAAHRIGAGLR